MQNRDIASQKKDREALSLDVAQQRERLNALKAGREEVRKLRLQAQKAADSLELKTREAEDDIARLQVQLNITKHQTEYDAIRQNIASHKADMAKWEDEELVLLQQLDELQREGAALDRQMAAEQDKLQQLERSVAEQAGAYDRNIQERERQRDESEKQIDPAVLAAYRRILSSRGDRALVLVKNNVCQGCFTAITKQMLNELQHDRDIIYCHSCGRILMLADEEL